MAPTTGYLRAAGCFQYGLTVAFPKDMRNGRGAGYYAEPIPASVWPRLDRVQRTPASRRWAMSRVRRVPKQLCSVNDNRRAQTIPNVLTQMDRGTPSRARRFSTEATARGRRHPLHDQRPLVQERRNLLRCGRH